MGNWSRRGKTSTSCGGMNSVTPYFDRGHRAAQCSQSHYDGVVKEPYRILKKTSGDNHACRIAWFATS